MKPPFFLLLFISSFAALLALPLSFELAIAPVVLTGLLAVMHADYGRRIHAPGQRVARRSKISEWFRLAA